MINKLIGMLIFPSVTREHSNCYIDLNLFFISVGQIYCQYDEVQKVRPYKAPRVEGNFFYRSENYLAISTLRLFPLWINLCTYYGAT